MSSQSDAYLAARAEFVKVQSKVFDTASLISKVGKQLNGDPEAFYFVNTPAPVAVTAAMNPSEGVDATKWYSPTEIMSLLADLRQKKLAMTTAWNSVQPDVRQGLVPPPGRLR